VFSVISVANNSATEGTENTGSMENEMEDSLTKQIISSAIEVHGILGPGLLESIYEEALCHEFSPKIYCI
jgi:hypothetical protein